MMETDTAGHFSPLFWHNALMHVEVKGAYCTYPSIYVQATLEHCATGNEIIDTEVEDIRKVTSTGSKLKKRPAVK